MRYTPLRALTSLAVAGISLSAPSTVFSQPASDEIAGATVIGSLPFADTVNTTTATNNPADPLLSCNASGNDGKTVWYVWTPAEDVTVRISTHGSTRTNLQPLDTVHGIFVGEPNALTELACVDDLSTDGLTFEATGGTTYYIKFGEYLSGVGGGNLIVHAEYSVPCYSPWLTMIEFLGLESLKTTSGMSIYYSDGNLDEAESIAEEYEPFATFVRDSLSFESYCPITVFKLADWNKVRSSWSFLPRFPGGATPWGDILLEAPIDGSILETHLSDIVQKASAERVEDLVTRASRVGMTVDEAVVWDAHTYWSHEYGHVVTRGVLGDHQPESKWLAEFTGQFTRYGRVALLEPERTELAKQLACTSYDGADRREAPSLLDLETHCLTCEDPMTEEEYLWYEAQIQVCAFETFDSLGFDFLKALTQFVPWQYAADDTLMAELDSVDTIAPGLKDCALEPAHVDLVCQQLSTSVSNEMIEVDLPTAIRLGQNYPNPFNSTTTISYVVPRSEVVALTVHDVLGNRIQILVSGVQTAGTHGVSFDAKDLPAGVYFYTLRAGDLIDTKRMTVVR